MDLTGMGLNFGDVVQSNVLGNKLLVLGTSGTSVILTGQGTATIDATDFIGLGIGPLPADPSGTTDGLVNGGGTADALFGGPGSDILTGEVGNDTLYGGADNDYLQGGQDDDAVFGGSGNDHVRGGTGNDQVWGGYGNDIVVGESGNDTLNGGIGTDTLWGESGNDVFLYTSYAGVETIMDFATGFDKVNYATSMGGPALAGNVATFVDGTSLVAGNAYNWVIGDFQAV